MAFYSAWRSAMLVPSAVEHQQELKQYLPRDSIGYGFLIVDVYTAEIILLHVLDLFVRDSNHHIKNKTELLKLRSNIKSNCVLLTPCI